LSGSEYSPPLGSPRRIQRKRIKGWRMPEGAIYVGRGSQWGNPFRVGYSGDAARCVELYRQQLESALRGGEACTAHFIRIARHLRVLRGSVLACWCRLDQPCHADVLLRVANVELSGR
jgi:hypothetical protein